MHCLYNDQRGQSLLYKTNLSSVITQVITLHRKMLMKCPSCDAEIRVNRKPFQCNYCKFGVIS